MNKSPCVDKTPVCCVRRMLQLKGIRIRLEFVSDTLRSDRYIKCAVRMFLNFVRVPHTHKNEMNKKKDKI